MRQMEKQAAKLQRALWQRAERFKLYKSGKLWLVSGIVSLFVGAGVMLSPQVQNVAASTATAGSTTEETSGITNTSVAHSSADVKASVASTSSATVVNTGNDSSTATSATSTASASTSVSAVASATNGSAESLAATSAATAATTSVAVDDSSAALPASSAATAGAETSSATSGSSAASAQTVTSVAHQALRTRSLASSAAPADSEVTTAINSGAANAPATVSYHNGSTQPTISVMVSGNFQAGDVVTVYLDTTAMSVTAATTVKGATESNVDVSTNDGRTVKGAQYQFSSDYNGAFPVVFVLNGTADDQINNGTSTATIAVDVDKNGTIVATNSVVLDKSYTMTQPNDTIRRNILNGTNGVTAGVIAQGAVTSELTLRAQLQGLQYFGDYSTLVNSSPYEKLTAASTVTFDFSDQLKVDSAVLSDDAVATGVTLTRSGNSVTLTLPSGLTLAAISKLAGYLQVGLLPVTVPTTSTRYVLPTLTATWTIDGQTNTVTEPGNSGSSHANEFAYNIQTYTAVGTVTVSSSSSYLGLLQQGTDNDYGLQWVVANESNFASGTTTTGSLSITSSPDNSVGITSVNGLDGNYLTSAGLSKNLTITFTTADGQSQSFEYVDGTTSYVATVGSATDPVTQVQIVDHAAQTAPYVTGSISHLQVGLIAYGDEKTTVTATADTSLYDGDGKLVLDTASSTDSDVVRERTVTKTYYPQPSIVLSAGSNGVDNQQGNTAQQIYNPGDELTESVNLLDGGTNSGSASDQVGRIGNGDGKQPAVEAVAAQNPMTIVVVAPTNTDFADDATLLSTLNKSDISSSGDLEITHLDDVDGRPVIAITGVDHYTASSRLPIVLQVNADAIGGSTISALNTIYVMPSAVLSQYNNGTILTSDGSLATDWATGNMYNLSTGGSQLGTIITASSFTANASITGSADSSAQVQTGTINVDDDQATGKTTLYNGTTNPVTDTLTTVNLVDADGNQYITLTGPVQVVDDAGNTVAAAVTYYQNGAVVTDPTQADSFTVSGVSLAKKGSYAVISYGLTVVPSQLAGALTNKTWAYQTSTQGYTAGTVATGNLVPLGAAISNTLVLQAIRDLTDTWYVAQRKADGTYVVDSAVAAVTTTGVVGRIYNGYTLMGTSAADVGQAYGDDGAVLVGVYDATTGQMVADGSMITYAEQVNSDGTITGHTYYLVTEQDVATKLNDVTVTYNGQTAASEVAGLQATANKVNVGLTSDDITVVKDGINAGTYTYQLNAQGLAKLQAAVGNDAIVTDVGVTGTITIQPAVTTVTLNPGALTYDGRTPASGASLTATVAGQTLKLNSGDVTVADDGIDVGTYTYQLTAAGLSSLQSQVGSNYVVTTGTPGMIVISPEQMPVTLSSGSLVYDGKTKASGAAVIATVNGEPLTLNDDDITVTNDGINVGTYNYQLNQTGLEKLQTLVGDDFTVVVGDPGTITITPAVVDVVLNDGSFTYDGNTAASAAKGLVATVNGTPVDLDNSDIEVTDDGVDAGNYAYQLNDAGLAKVQLVVGSNYQVSVAVTGTITITPASITAALSDGGFTYDGATKASEATGLTATANSQAVDLSGEDIEVTNDGTGAGNYAYQLSDAGLAKVQSVVGTNYTVVLGGSGTVTIAQVVATTVLSDGGFTFDGTTKASEVTNLTASVVGKTVGLDSSDIDVTDDGSAAGDYVYQLNATGLAKVQSAAGANYTVRVGDTGTITIAKAQATTALSDGGFTYDGTTKASGAPKLIATVVGQTVELDSSDVDVTDDGSAAGDYVYQLNATGLAKVQSTAGANYIVGVGDTGMITIAKAAVTTALSDGGFTYDGTTEASGAPKLTATVVGQTVDLDSSDIDVTNDDVAAGDYVYQLNSTGLAKVQSAAGGNYTVAVGDAGTITIAKSAVTTILSDGGFTYDGTTKASGVPKLTASVVGQTVDLDSSDIDVTNDDVAAGDYVYQLNSTGLAKVQSAVGPNYTVGVGDTGTITITPASITTTLSDGGFTYDGTTKASGAPKLTATVVGQTVELDSSDVDVTDNGSAAGDYVYQLNANGLEKVQSAAGANYIVRVGDTGTITIAKAPATTTLSDGGFTYDGTTKASGAPKLTATVVGQTVELDSSDIDVINDAIAVGSYDYQLNATGLAKVQSAAGGNYTVGFGDAGTITITPASITTTLSDGGFTYDGTTKASGAPKLTATVIGQTVDLDSSDIDITNDATTAGNYDYQLNATGLAKVQSVVGPNYTVVLGGSGTVSISQVVATTVLSDGGFTFDGTTKASEVTNLTASVVGQTVELDSDDIIVTDDGSAAGDYVYQLNSTGLAKVQSAAGPNYTVAIGDVGTITIAKAAVTTALSDGGFTYNGTTKASGAPKLTATVVVQTVDLDSSDIDVTNDGTAAGDYSYQLNATGLSKVKDVAGPNYTVSVGDPGKIEIVPAKDTTSLSNGGFTFDGQTKASGAAGLTATVAGKTIHLTSTDIEVVDDGVNAGHYTYQLSTVGLNKVAAAVGSDYTVGVGNTGTIEIIPAAVTMTLSNGGFTFDGATKASGTAGLTATGAMQTIDLDGRDIEVINDDVAAGSYKYQLSAAGISKAQAQLGNNYRITAGGTGTITITPAGATATLSTGGFIFDGSTPASATSGLTASAAGHTVSLATNDITVTSDGVNAGSYSYQLNVNGLAQLQATIGTNYTVSAGDSGIITIAPLAVTTALTNGGFIFDGTTTASGATGLTATVAGQRVELDSNDIVVTNDGVHAGQYRYQLSVAGLAQVQAAMGHNYAVSVGADGTITITPLAITTTLNTSGFTYDGTTTASAATGLTATADGQTVALNSNDIEVVNDGVAAGSYTYQLNAAGIAKVQAQVGNDYTVGTGGTGMVAIAPATATTKLSDGGFTFDGHTKASDASGLTAMVAGKTVALDQTDIEVTGDDVAAGAYDYRLNAAGLTKVQNAVGHNYTATAGGTGKITITPAVVTTTLSNGGFTFDGTTTASEAGGLTATVAGQVVELDSDDIAVDADGTTAGGYVYQLSAAGLAKVQRTVGVNYTVSVGGEGMITITPAEVATILSDDSFTYDGRTTASAAGGLTATVAGQTINLGSDDIDVTGDDVVAGNYDYQLSATGLAKVQAAVGSDYTVHVGEGGTIAITPAATTTKLSDGSFTFDGTTTASSARGLTATVAGRTVALDSGDIVVAHDNIAAGSYAYQLSHTGLATVQATVGANYSVGVGDTGTITIMPATVTTALSDGGFGFDGHTLASGATGLTVTIAGRSLDLDGADIKVVGDSTNVGTYAYQVNAAGMHRVQTVLGSNYTVTAGSAGTITITPVAVTTMLSDGGFTYDGRTSASEVAGLTATVAGQTVELHSDDIDLTGNGVDVGKYAYQLSQAGLTRVQATVGANYVVSVGEPGMINITPVTTVPRLNDVVFTYDGTTQASGAPGLTATAAGRVVPLDDGDITVTSDAVRADTYHYQLNAAGLAKVQAAVGADYIVERNGATEGTITIQPAVTTATVPVTRTIVYHGAGMATPAAVTQEVAYTAVTTSDGRSRTTIYTPNGSFGAVISPVIAGYTVSGDVPAQMLTLTTMLPVDTTVVITYSPVAPQPGATGGDHNDHGAASGNRLPATGATGHATSTSTVAGRVSAGTTTNNGAQRTPVMTTTAKAINVHLARVTNAVGATQVGHPAATHQLPQTGGQVRNGSRLPQTGDEQTGVLRALGVGLLTLISLAGLWDRKRKRD